MRTNGVDNRRSPHDDGDGAGRSSGAHDDNDGALKRLEGRATTAICWRRIAHDDGDGMLE